MAYPTLTCKISAGYFAAFGQSQPTIEQFNQVRVLAPDGTWGATYVCDPGLSTFLPSQSAVNPLTGAEAAEIWMPLVGLFTGAFLLRQIYRAAD